MTKEELKKEAQEQVNRCTPLYPECFIQGYIASAEPREKRIEELELELTVEKDQHQEETNLHLHAEEYIKSLERENAEQKEKLEHRNCLDCSNHDSNMKLLKAKEIIALGLRVCETSSIEYMNLYQKQAEQFLKEIEK